MEQEEEMSWWGLDFISATDGFLLLLGPLQWDVTSILSFLIKQNFFIRIVLRDFFHAFFYNYYYFVPQGKEKRGKQYGNSNKENSGQNHTKMFYWQKKDKNKCKKV